MTVPLRVLHLEDDVHDAALIKETLEAGGFECQVTRVEDEPAFLAALELGCSDVILADYTLPSFDGVSALRLVRRDWPHIPFIFVSGTLDEDLAIEALKIGATDYVFKTRLSRMVPALQRALREAAERLELSRAERALRRSESYLTEAQRLTHAGSFAWNTVTGDVYWSQELFRLFDIDPNTVVTMDLVMQRAHPADRRALEVRIASITNEAAAVDFQYRLCAPDGRIKHLHVTAHPVTDDSGRLVAVGAMQDITERKRAELAVRHARIREVESRYTAMMEERTRLAREIHDTLLQGFAGLTLRLDVAAREARDPAQTAALNQLCNLAERTLREARHAVWDLRDSSRDNDLVAALRLDADTVVKQTGLEYEFVTTGAPRSVDAQSRDVLLRVMREAMTNAVRHAKAKRLRLRLSFRPHSVRLSVRDDGVGFTVKRNFEAYGDHWGLRGMCERAAQIGATLKVRSKVGVGTEVLLAMRPRSRKLRSTAS